MAIVRDSQGNPVRTSTGQPVTTKPGSSKATGGAKRAAASAVTSGNINVNAVASAVEGAANEVVSAISAPIQAAAGAVQGFASALGGNFAGAGFGGLNSLLSGLLSGFPPWPNDLEQFASYNYIFTLSCLTNYELNIPDFTYRLFGPRIVVLRSGGAPDKIPTLTELGGKMEFYIDDVDITSLVTHTPQTTNSFAGQFGFKVFEPYSMGQFLENLQVAAIAAGHKNYISAPFCLSLEFIGYDDAGRVHKSRRSTRHFPIRLNEVTFQVEEKGSTYDVVATPWQESALSDQVQQSRTDITVSGRTVEEALQSGAGSLATILNTRMLKNEQAKQVSKADKFVIMFPTKRSSIDEAVLGSKEDEKGATTKEGELRADPFEEDRKKELYESINGIQNGAVPVDFDEKLKSLLGLTITRSEISETIREYVEKDENINNIGKAKLVVKQNEASQNPQPDATVTWDEFGNPINRQKVQIPKEVRSFQFPLGTKIQKIIEEVIVASEWGQNLKDRLNQPDENNMVEWFRVETQCFNMMDGATVDATGDTPKVFVYRVVPYKVNASIFSSPSAPQPNQKNLIAQAAKEYNYIYSGKNKDIIDFDIKFDNAFFVAIGASRGQNNAGSKTKAQTGTAATDKEPSTQLNQGTQGEGSVSATGQAKVKETNAPASGKVGSGTENTSTQIARMFSDALMNSTTDLAQIELKIWGDPYYLSDSGMGNYIAAPTTFLNITKDGTMDYQSSEVDLRLTFRTPIDYGYDGWMEFPSVGLSPVKAFNGLYKVLQVSSNFSGGQFTQTLTAIRRRNQETDTKQVGTKGGNAVVQEGPPETKIDNTAPLP